jgi:hypothetical protein
LRHLDRLSVLIDRDHGQVGGAGVPDLGGDGVLRLDPDADLHRRPPDGVDAGRQRRSSPTYTGSVKVIRSIPAVTTRLPE